jgi:hypothetical protein
MPTPRTTRLLAAILAAALIGAAWSSGLETIELDGYRATFDPNQDFLMIEGDLDCSPYGGPTAVRVTETSGRLGEAAYLIYQPADWNGDLVLFAHDEASPYHVDGEFWFPLPLGFGPDIADMRFVQARDAALCHGFGWAASASESYSAAIEDMMRGTHLLGALAPRHLTATPGRTFVTGHWLGGLPALALAESHPHRYAGAVIGPAPIGGSRMFIDEMMHVAALFDVLFPDVVEHERDRGMLPAEVEEFVGVLMARIEADPVALLRLASIHMPGSERHDPNGVGHPVLWPDPSLPDGFMALASELFDFVVGYLVAVDDVRTRGGDGLPFDNQHVVYRGEGWSPEDEADLNARVPRHAADRQAVRYWTFYYEPSGALQVPLVSIRTPWGQYPEHAWTYDDRVSRSGANDLYSVWHIPKFVVGETYATALLALVEWVDRGVRPTWPPAP